MSVCCVVVTYNPEIEYLKKVLASISANDVKVVLVDNGSSNYDSITTCSGSDIVSLSLEENRGIAAAQNHGIKWAIENSFDYVWLSDQDTLYPKDYTLKMMSYIDSFSESTEHLGVIGPALLELNRNKIQPFVKFDFFTKHVKPKPGLNEVSHLIASGMIIPVSAFMVVGFKREDLFIDWVDLEWCWRAFNSGLRVYGVGDVFIEHNLGDEMVSVVNKKISIRSSTRHYYIIRNGVYLSLYSDLLPFGVRLEYLFRSFAFVIFYGCFSRGHRAENFRMCFKGLLHGVFKKLGKLL